MKKITNNANYVNLKIFSIALMLFLMATWHSRAQAKFNRNIKQSAHTAIGHHIKNGISVFSFAPNGGWALVTKNGKFEKENIPVECEKKVKEFLAKGYKIRDIAFPPKGGNSWVILADKGKFARNIPAECNQKLDEYYKRGNKPIKVSFPPKGSNSWVIVDENGKFFARNIDDECYQILRNLTESDMPNKKAARKITGVVFDPKGGFVVLAEDYHFARNIDKECFTKMNTFSKNKNMIHKIAFDSDGKGWSVISNKKVTNRPTDKIREFENNVAGKSIWNLMRELDVPGVSVGVVINGKLAWTTAYGHLKKGDRKHAVHPESMFQAASVSKVFAAVGVYKLADERKIGISQNLLTANQLKWPKPFHNSIANQPWTKNFKHVTILNILNHISGIEGRGSVLKSGSRDYKPKKLDGNFPGGGYSGYKTLKDVPNLDSLMGSVKITYDPPAKPNGRNSWYSGKAFTLLQKLTTDIGRQAYPSWMKSNVLQPMGMKNSSFTITPERSYSKDELTWGHLASSNSSVRRIYPQFAAAGLYTNAKELTGIIRTINNHGVLNGRRVISSNYANLLSKGNGTNTSDGGIDASNDYYCHGGSNTGYRAFIIGFKDLKGNDGIKNAGIIVLTNAEKKIIRYQITNAVIKAYGW